MKFIVVLLVAIGANSSSIGNAFRLPGRQTSFATFNAALLPSFGEVDERVPVLIQLIRDSNLDVVCLQEVWKASIQRQIYGGLSNLYPYFVSQIDLRTPGSNSTAAACSLSELTGVVVCNDMNCRNSTSRTCGLRECTQIISALSDECRLCVIINPLPNVCLTEPAANYERSFPMMLISKKEINQQRIEGYQGNVSEIRAFFQASIMNVGEVFCTHLSVGADGTDNYVGPPFVSPFLFDSYAEQQYRELVRLLDVASQRDNSVLLGDFNHGPTLATYTDTPNITYEMPFNYGYVHARGYYSPYVLMDGRCTFCFERNGGFPSRVLDHIYVPATASRRVITAQRIWENVRTPSGRSLSDHYGVKAILRDLTSCSYDWWFCLFREGRNHFPPLDPPDRELRNICQALS